MAIISMLVLLILFSVIILLGLLLKKKIWLYPMVSVVPAAENVFLNSVVIRRTKSKIYVKI